MKTRDEGDPVIGLQILLYAATTLTEMDFASRRHFDGYILNEQLGYRMRTWYVPDEAEWSNPYVSPLLAEDHGNLPPAYIMTADFDPLRDEGRAYAESLEFCGVPVVYHNYSGMLHGFLSFEDLLAIVPVGDRPLKEPDEVYAEIATIIEQTFAPSSGLER